MTILAKDKMNVELQEDGIELRAQPVDGIGVSFERWPAGDYRPLFKGLPNDACLAVHYGYCIRGKAKAIYADREEILQAGDAYVLQPGHTFVVLEAFESIEFTPLTPEYGRVGEVFLANLPTWLKARAKAAPGGSR